MKTESTVFNNAKSTQCALLLRRDQGYTSWVNLRNLTSVFVILALCVGQLVSNAHLIGHLSESTDDHDHLAAFSDELHWHLAHADHEAVHIQHTDHEAEHIQPDCAAYHVLAGMAGLAPAVANCLDGAWVGLPMVRLNQTTAIGSWNVSPPPIRGPPIFS